MAGLDSYTKLLLHFSGSDGSTTIIDSTGLNSPTTSGNAVVSSSQSVFGGTSLRTTAGYVSIPDTTELEFGSGDWTIDCWIRLSTTAGALVIYANGYQTAANRSLLFYVTATELHCAQSTDGSTNSDVGRSWSPSINTWYHFAAVRTGAVVKLFIDGTQVGADITATSLFNSPIDKRIGSEASSNFNGWIDEFRVSKGIARWTTTFTPPDEEYSEDVVPIVYQKLQMIL